MKDALLKFIIKFRMVLLLLCFLLLVTALGHANSTMRFDHNKWMNANEIESLDERKKMAQDLVDNNYLIGKSKQQVFEILGDAEQYFNEESNELYYLIEENYGFDIDPVKIEYLVVSFDSKDQVNRAYRKITLDK